MYRDFCRDILALMLYKICEQMYHDAYVSLCEYIVTFTVTARPERLDCFVRESSAVWVNCDGLSP